MTYNYNSNRNGLVSKSVTEEFTFDYYVEDKPNHYSSIDLPDNLDDACSNLTSALKMLN